MPPLFCPGDPHDLTDRQERFVHEYLPDQNASAAALRAGYSPKTRDARAAELMKTGPEKVKNMDIYGHL